MHYTTLNRRTFQINKGYRNFERADIANTTWLYWKVVNGPFQNKLTQRKRVLNQNGEAAVISNARWELTIETITWRIDWGFSVTHCRASTENLKFE